MMNYINEQTISYVILTSYLLICAIKDLLTCTISKKLSLIYSCILIIVTLFDTSFSIDQHLLALIPGVILLLLGILTKEAIGLGDGIVILVMGIVLSMDSVITICTIAFFLAAFVSVILLVKRHMKNHSIPFVPFIFCAYVIYMVQAALEVI